MKITTINHGENYVHKSVGGEFTKLMVSIMKVEQLLVGDLGAFIDIPKS